MTGPRTSATRSRRADAPVVRTDGGGHPEREPAAPAWTSLRWRLVLDPPLPGADNMARDHALARELPSGSAVLRLYRWARPTVSFGRNEAAVGRYDLRPGEVSGMDFVRRPTGGRAVLHDRELTYAVVAPLDAFGGLRAGYRAINRALLRGLASLGARVDAAPAPRRPVRPHEGPCFMEPAEGELMVEGRKLVGSAQARLEGALLQHGSILLGGDQAALARIRGEGAGEGAVATLASALGRTPAWDEVARAVAGAFRERVDGEWTRGEMTPAEEGAAAELSGRYGSEAWTWRR